MKASKPSDGVFSIYINESVFVDMSKLNLPGDIRD